MESRKRASFCTTEMQRSWDSVKGRGSTSGASLAVEDSASNVERGHSAVRRRRIRSLKCWKKNKKEIKVFLGYFFFWDINTHYQRNYTS